jgi:hypothetical protein
VRVIVCGSRDFSDAKLLGDELFRMVGTTDITIVHGAARGADELAGREALRRGDKEERHPADWSKGKSAGILRNIRMAELGADLCIAFWDGRSSGTAHMIAVATTHGIPVRIVPTTVAERSNRSDDDG